MSHRAYVQSPPWGASSYALPDGEAHHVRDVLRLGPGARMEVFDGEGRVADAVIERCDRRGVAIAIGNPRAGDVEPGVGITLAVALLKGRKMDLVVEKATELGVGRILPVEVERSLPKKKLGKLDRWRRIAESAAAQSGRSVVPEIAGPVDFLDMVEEAAQADVAWICHAGRGRGVGSDAASGAAVGRVLVATGPEGDFTDGEMDAAEARGMVPIRIGPRTLRAETAAIVAVALAQIVLGDLAAR